MKVSIIIPTSVIWVPEYHKVFDNCIASIEKNAGYRNYEIIIVDNVMYNDDARIVIEKCKRKGYRVIPYQFRFHRSKVSNMAAKYAKGEYLLFLDNDTTPQKNFLKELVDTLHTDKQIKLAGPKIINPYSMSRYTYGYTKNVTVQHLPLNSAKEPTPSPSQEGNTKSPLLGGDLGVGELLPKNVTVQRSHLTSTSPFLPLSEGDKGEEMSPAGGGAGGGNIPRPWWEGLGEGDELIPKNGKGFILVDEKMHENGSHIKDREALPLCCLLVEKKVFDEVGGFDDAYQLYNADIDLSLKIRAKGYRCVVNKNAAVVHYGGLSIGIFKDDNFPRSYDDILLNRKWFNWNRNTISTSSRKELLVIKLLTLGDAVLVTPTLKAIREKYPSHRITLVTCKGWKDVFEGNPYIDELAVTIDHPKSSFKPSHYFYDEITTQYIDKKEWDQVIQLNCLSFAGEYKRTGIHFRDFYAEIAGVYPLKDTKYFIPITDDHRKTIDKILQQFEIGKKLICIHTNGGWALKNWSENRWMKFAERIYDRYQCKVILVGGKGEAINSPYIINLADKLSIKELVALFERADLFVGLDSGPMHIASAANTPIIAMFSVTHAKVGAPNSDNFITIQAPLSCEIPCGLKHCYKEINCTDSISVNTVLKAAEKLLNRKEAIKEDWKGDLPARILFKDWEWHTINQERGEDTTLLRALQIEKKQTINVTIHPHLNLPPPPFSPSVRGTEGRIQGDNEYSPPLVGGVRACPVPDTGGEGELLPIEEPGTSQRLISVLYQTRGNIFELPGGDTEYLLKLESDIKKYGCKIQGNCNQQISLEEFDIIHIINFETHSAINAALQQKPYIVTPLYKDFNQHIVASRRLVSLFKEYIDSGNHTTFEKGLAVLHNMGNVSNTPADYNFIVSHAETILVSGESERDQLKRDFPNARNIEIVKLGFDRPTDTEHISPGLFVSKYGIKDFVLCVGRLEARKNQLMLLYALKDEDIPIVFVNSKTSQLEYEELCKRFKRKGKTIFTGRVTREMLFSAYKAAKVHALPSWYEVPGLVSLEAGWVGCNVVASGWGTIKDYLGEYAYYCEPHDPESIKKAVLTAFNDPRDRKLPEILKDYTSEKMAETVLGIYKRVLSECNTENGLRRLKENAEHAYNEKLFYQLRKTVLNLSGKNPQEAIEPASRLLSFRPNDPVSHFIKGTACLLSTNYQEAEANLMRALNLRPSIHIKEYLYLSLSLLKQKKYEDAIEILQQSLQVHPFVSDKSRITIYEYLLKCYEGIGNTEKIVETINKIQVLNSNFTEYEMEDIYADLYNQ